MKEKNEALIYRAVSKKEFDDIVSNKRFQPKLDKTGQYIFGYSGKCFGLSFQDVLAFAKRYKGEYTRILRVKLLFNTYEYLKKNDTREIPMDPEIFKSGTLHIEKKNLSLLSDPLLIWHYCQITNEMYREFCSRDKPITKNQVLWQAIVG